MFSAGLDCGSDSWFQLWQLISVTTFDILINSASDDLHTFQDFCFCSYKNGSKQPAELQPQTQDTGQKTEGASRRWIN